MKELLRLYPEAVFLVLWNLAICFMAWREKGGVKEEVKGEENK